MSKADIAVVCIKTGVHLVHKINLVVAAKENTHRIEDEYEAVSQEKPKVTEFAKYAQAHARVSINRHARPLLELLKQGRMLTGYQDAQRLGETFEEYLQQQWWPGGGLVPFSVMKFIRRRVVYYNSCHGGENHFFGALNCGNAGAAAKNGVYGYYCLVLKDAPIADTVVYCYRDTLAEDAYWTCDEKSQRRDVQCSKCTSKENPKCQVNQLRLTSALAPQTHRGRLAAIKHKNNIDQCKTKDGYAEMVIKPIPGQTEEYIEACFAISFTLDCIEEVRLHKGLAIDLIDEASMDEDRPPADCSSPMVQHQLIRQQLGDSQIPFNPEV